MTEACAMGRVRRIRCAGQQHHGKHVGNDTALVDVAIVVDDAKLAEIAVILILAVDLVDMHR